jgi:acyl-CoA synthetase (AMP-forming)/AMP-acid ligase II
VDDEDNELRVEGATGDILIRSPCMVGAIVTNRIASNANVQQMLGYMHNKKATEEAFDSQGWLRTGDIGQMIEGSKLFVVDRRKDLLKVRGWQVSPAEVENTILTHPCVLDAAVIGIAQEDETEIPRAYIVLRPDTVLLIDDLKRFIGQSLARYKIPEEFIFIDRIPKNATGKILRRVLKELANSENCKPESPPASFGEPKRRRSWRHVREMSSGSVKTISMASRSLLRFLTWLRSMLLLK